MLYLQPIVYDISTINFDTLGNMAGGIILLGKKLFTSSSKL